ncbi:MULTISPECIES: cytochrome c biogenesis protein ResB [Bacillales]|uniref:Cytochrome c biogenesis protein ResB n=1 Tax=Lysinibacillus louembei TaxID=1470088 RepID=A0ABZ0RX07_9BACI|nr:MULTISPECIES: cytochrome c biogenesis protein ResB [Bacillales]MCT6923692.1 cytochrome c biogenesis protein ResB [Metasolibacillus sp.]MCT6939585.1 cytochrome c biogenesis protein ResB [Metasolibacillus sp.]WPK11782.1 cytochrome c biogenesis protein ResB [Lysinibacillus louembei]
MEKIICTCKHENPVGTTLCERCGRPLTTEEQDKAVLDMRYDGVAIRSKTHNKSIIDKIWNFFSSVKVGVTLIIITLIAASIGTIFPQEFAVNVATEAERAKYYTDMYGAIGTLYYNLGLADLYSSWWFQTIVGMLAVSIIVASIDRGIPLHRSLTNQRVKRHIGFMKRQRIVAEGQPSEQADKTLDLIEEEMKKLKYKVRRENNALFAEKGRFSRYGPYVNHVGLIVFLGAVMLRLVPGFYVDTSIWLREGEMVAVDGMEGYFLYNDKFILETYDNDPRGEQLRQGVNVVAKNYQTNVKLYKQKEGAVPGQTSDLEELQSYEIRVNHPLKQDGYSIFQMDYRLNELKTMHFELQNKATEEFLGQVSIDLTAPQKEYVIDDQTKVQIVTYLPDFSGFKDGVPQTASPYPENPAFIFRMFTPETPEGETSFVAIRETLEPLGENQYKMKFSNVDTRNVSGLTIRKDTTIPILFIGGIIFMIGVVMGSYWNHRRLWVEQLEDGSIRLAAHANKNWFSMKKDLDAVTAYAHLPQYVDQVEKEQEKEGDNTL